MFRATSTVTINGRVLSGISGTIAEFHRSEYDVQRDQIMADIRLEPYFQEMAETIDGSLIVTYTTGTIKFVEFGIVK